MKNLLIVESPGKIQTISKFMGADFDVMASFGHIFEIDPTGLNIDVKNRTFRPKIRVIPGKEDVVRLIRSKSDAADAVFICTDDDSEGTRIGFDISTLVKDKSKVKRAVFHEITKKAVTSAISSPVEININHVNSQMARQILDRLIGYTVSPMLWRTTPGGKSAGRVQSVALRLIADREFEIETFKTDKFWDVAVGFAIGDQIVAGAVITKEKGNRIPTQEYAEMAKLEVEKSTPVVSTVTSKLTKRSAQPPFDTASLQKQASSNFNWKAARTMEVAQTLYESGKITYMRTDSFVVSDEAAEMCSKYINDTYGSKYLPKVRPVHLKKSKSQEAHECIRPTSLRGESWVDGVEALDPEQQQLFDMIRDRFIASQMSDLEVRKTDIVVKAGRCQVGVEGKVITFDGWTKVLPPQGKEVFLPEIKEGNKLQISEVQVKEHETRPPDRFNDGSLVTKMEKEGVGRPSTWAVLVDSLEKRGYVTRNGKNFHLTPVGREVNKFLMSKFSNFFMDIAFTSQVEDELENISQGKTDKLDVIRQFYDRLDELVNEERNKTWDSVFGQLGAKDESVQGVPGVSKD